jgi:hypothetical protein
MGVLSFGAFGLVVALCDSCLLSTGNWTLRFRRH